MPSNLRKTARAIAMAFATLVFLDGTLILESIQAQGLPSDWVAYYRPGRLVVPHPPGWQVQEGGDGAFVVVRQVPGSLPEALVYVKPQRFGPTRSAADALGLHATRRGRPLPRCPAAACLRARTAHRGRAGRARRTPPVRVSSRPERDLPGRSRPR